MKKNIRDWYDNNQEVINLIGEYVLDAIPGSEPIKAIYDLVIARQDDLEDQSIEQRIGTLENKFSTLQEVINSLNHTLENLKPTLEPIITSLNAQDNFDRNIIKSQTKNERKQYLDILFSQNDLLKAQVNKLQIPLLEMTKTHSNYKRKNTTRKLRKNLTQTFNNPNILNGMYKLEEKIAVGGQATIHKGINTHTKAPVAIKLFPANLFNNPDIESSLQEEYNLVTKLDHPNIIHYNDFGSSQAKQQYFFVMEYIDGQNLRSIMNSKESKKWDFQEIYTTLTPIASALDYIHDNKIVHSDIKPLNILIDKKRGGILTDFGFSRQTLDTITTYGLNTAFNDDVDGTLPYMSPERYQGQAASTASDIWSFGTIIYEMLAGYKPYTASSFEGYRNAIVKTTPESLENKTLWDILQYAFIKDPQERIASASMLLNELARVQNINPIDPTSTHAGQRASSNFLNQIYKNQESQLSHIIVSVPTGSAGQIITNPELANPNALNPHKILEINKISQIDKYRQNMPLINKQLSFISPVSLYSKVKYKIIDYISSPPQFKYKTNKVTSTLNKQEPNPSNIKKATTVSNSSTLEQKNYILHQSSLSNFLNPYFNFFKELFKKKDNQTTSLLSPSIESYKNSYKSQSFLSEYGSTIVKSALTYSFFLGIGIIPGLMIYNLKESHSLANYIKEIEKETNNNIENRKILLLDKKKKQVNIYASYWNATSQNSRNEIISKYIENLDPYYNKEEYIEMSIVSKNMESLLKAKTTSAFIEVATNAQQVLPNLKNLKSREILNDTLYRAHYKTSVTLAYLITKQYQTLINKKLTPQLRKNVYGIATNVDMISFYHLYENLNKILIKQNISTAKKLKLLKYLQVDKVINFNDSDKYDSLTRLKRYNTYWKHYDSIKNSKGKQLLSLVLLEQMGSEYITTIHYYLDKANTNRHSLRSTNISTDYMINCLNDIKKILAYIPLDNEKAKQTFIELSVLENKYSLESYINSHLIAKVSYSGLFKEKITSEQKDLIEALRLIAYRDFPYDKTEKAFEMINNYLQLSTTPKIIGNKRYTEYFSLWLTCLEKYGSSIHDAKFMEKLTTALNKTTNEKFSQNKKIVKQYNRIYNKSLQFFENFSQKTDTSDENKNIAIRFLLKDKYKNIDTTKDYASLINLYERLGDNLTLEEAIKLGDIYYYGKGNVTLNISKAISYYEKKIIIENIPTNPLEAMFDFNINVIKKLGNYYYEQGINDNTYYKKALKYYLALANFPITDKYLLNLADMYFNGKGTEKNYEKALEWYKYCQKSDFIESYIHLAKMYENGLGTAIDKEKALSYYTQLIPSQLSSENRKKVGISLVNDLRDELALKYLNDGKLSDDYEVLQALTIIYSRPNSPLTNSDKAIQYGIKAVLLGSHISSKILLDFCEKEIKNGNQSKKLFDTIINLCNIGIKNSTKKEEIEKHESKISNLINSRNDLTDTQKINLYYQQYQKTNSLMFGLKVARAYQEGNIIEKNNKQSAIIYESLLKTPMDLETELAVLGNLGNIYLYGGYGVNTDINKTISYYQAYAAKIENNSTQIYSKRFNEFTKTTYLFLAQHYKKINDHENTKKWYIKAAQIGVEEAMKICAYGYKNITFLKRLADQGDSEAAYQYGIHQIKEAYKPMKFGHNFLVIDQNDRITVAQMENAYQYFQISLKKQIKDSTSQLGYTFLLRNDKGLARQFFKEGAKKNESLSYYGLGMLELGKMGRWSGKNNTLYAEKALEFFEKGYEIDESAWCAQMIGYCYFRGYIKHSKNIVTNLFRKSEYEYAREYFLKAINKNDPTQQVSDAYFYLGEMYFDNSYGIKKDKITARNYYEKAQDLGNTSATVRLRQLR